jgi:hypothetical protein
VVANRGRATQAFPGHNSSDAAWAGVVACIQNQFRNFNIVVTDLRPADGPYVEAHFGGDGSELSLPLGTGGVAPIDNGSCSVLDRAVVFVFSSIYGANAQALCEAGTQEVAHALSLDHEYLCQDPMTYVQGCGPKSFQDRDAPCGETSPRACICGRPSQNSVRVLLEKVGPAGPPDTAPPSVQLVSPGDGARIGDPTFQVVARATDDRALGRLELHVVTRGIEQVGACGGALFPCTQRGDTVTFTVPAPPASATAGDGDGTTSIKVVAIDTAGNRAESDQRDLTFVAGAPDVDPGAGGPVTIDAGDLRITIAGMAPRYAPDSAVSLDLFIAAARPTLVASTHPTLVWIDPRGREFEVPLCDRGEGQWVAHVKLGDLPGDRSFIVRADDGQGNVAATPVQAIHVAAGQTP